MAEFTAFSKDEYAQRLARARAALTAANVDAVICTAPENMFYLCGYDSWTAAVNPQGLVISARADDEPVLLIRNVDLAYAQESVGVGAIRTFKLKLEQPAELLDRILCEKGVKSGKIGIDFEAAGMTGAFALELLKVFGNDRLVDVTRVLGDLRIIKSEAELRYMRKAATYANAGLKTIRTALRAGRTEIEVAADVEMAMRSAGSDYWAIPTEFTSGNRTAAVHGTPRPRKIRHGDLAHFEFAGVEARYHAVGISTISVGDPGKRARDLHRVSAAAVRAGSAAIRVGAKASDVEAASFEPLRREGLLEYVTGGRFGYGIGIAYPPIWLETLQIDLPSNQTLQRGMAFVLHTAIYIPSEKIGTMQGGTYAIGDNGLEMLAGDGDTELETL